MMRNRGFTLIELMVVISIIALLASVIAVSFSSASAKARDGARRAGLVQIANLLEIYYNTNGHYPVTNCTFHASNPGQPSSVVYSSDGNYIPGLVPEYIPALPKDPRGKLSDNPVCSAGWSESFMYISNYDGSGYKFMSHCGPEGKWDRNDGLYDSVRPTWAWAVSGGALGSSGEPLNCTQY